MRKDIISKYFMKDLSYLIFKYDYYLEGKVDKVLEGHKDYVDCLYILPDR